MKTYASAAALLLAACMAPRAERHESPPAEPPPTQTPALSERATCTREDPCTLEVVEIARRRVALEADTEGKMTEADVSQHNKRVAEHWMQTLARSIAEERDQFSHWCEMAQGWSAARRKSGAPGLTSEDLLKWTGQPTHEMKPESSDGTAEAKAWTWDVYGPLSRNVSFAILFMRPAGTDGPWLFAGCQWCASGGPATSPGCVMLPVKR